MGLLHYWLRSFHPLMCRQQPAATDFWPPSNRRRLKVRPRPSRGRVAAAGFETRVSRAQGPLPTPAENQPVGPYVSALDKEPGSCGPNTRHNDFTTSLARSFFFHLILCVRARPLRPLNFQPQKFSHVTKRVTVGPLRVLFREKKNSLTSDSFDVSLYPKR